MERSSHILSVLGLVVFLTGCASMVPKAALLPGQHGTSVLRLASEVRAVVGNEEKSKLEKDVLLANIVTVNIDVEYFASTTLRGRAPSLCEGTTRDEFKALLVKMLVRRFNLMTRRNTLAALELRYEGEGHSNGKAWVRVTAPYPGNDLDLEFKLHFVNGRWLIYDVFAGGVSTAEDYGAQFSQIVRQQGMCAVVQALREK